MTKLYFSEDSLVYQMEMAELVRHVVKEKFIAGVKSGGGVEPSWLPADLLPPPKIENLDLCMYQGGVNDVISIQTSDDFGIVNIYLVLQDENGNLIESGNAFDWPEEPNHWAYLTRASIPSGTSVTVHAAVIDGFGNMSTRSERITVNDRSQHGEGL